jgi:hypothetical protein
MDPTSRGDTETDLCRRWYEVNRESWWQRHRPNADRKGAHADEWMIGFRNEVLRIGHLSDHELMKEYE